MKRTLVGAFAPLVAALACVLILNVGYRAEGTDSEHSRIQIGFAIASLPLHLAGKNPAPVGLGSYLVAACDCNGCHTRNFEEAYLPGGNPFRGQPERINPSSYLVGGNEFGPFVSRNLRTDPSSGLPAGLTFEQFLEVFRKGTEFKNDPPTPFPSPLLQVMPWPNLAKLTERDIQAIYEYLSTLSPAPAP